MVRPINAIIIFSDNFTESKEEKLSFVIIGLPDFEIFKIYICILFVLYCSTQTHTCTHTHKRFRRNCDSFSPNMLRKKNQLFPLAEKYCSFITVSLCSFTIVLNYIISFWVSIVPVLCAYCADIGVEKHAMFAGL